MNNLNWEEKFENKLNITEKDYHNILSTINNEENKQKIKVIPIEVKRTLSNEFINQNPEFALNLEEILKIFALSNGGLGYKSGMSFIAKTILKLTNNNKIKAFIILRNIFEDDNLKSLYENNHEKIKDMYEKFKLKLKEKISILYNYFVKNNIDVQFIHGWIMSLFSFNFDDKIGEYVFKLYIIKKDFNVYYDAALAILKCFENEILNHNEILYIYSLLNSAKINIDANTFIYNMNKITN